MSFKEKYMKVKILETDERLGVTAGEIYEAKRYFFDPTEKLTLISRIPDGYDPMCNMYTHEVAYLFGDNWKIIEGNIYVPEDEQERAKYYEEMEK